MGCTSSKLDDLPAVILCRDRVNFLNQCLTQRYHFSNCHNLYVESLNEIGTSVFLFFESASTLPPPIVTKTDGREHQGDLRGVGAPARHSGSAGSHIDFHSDDSDHDHGHDHGHIPHVSDSGSDSGSVSEIHSPKQNYKNPHPNTNTNTMYQGSGVGFPNTPPNYPYPYQDSSGVGLGLDMDRHTVSPFPNPGMYTGMGMGMGMEEEKPYAYPYPNPYQNSNPNPYTYPGGGTQMNYNYMKRHVTQSVSYEQKPGYSETVQYGQFGQSYYGGGEASTSKVAAAAVVPPPPPPASGSGWDFLNPFESIENNNYPVYRTATPSSRDSREVREEEGIPDLEEEDFANEVVKEVHGHQKLVDEMHKVEGHNVRDVDSISSIESDDGDEDGHDSDSDGIVKVVEKNDENRREFNVEMVDKKVVGGGNEENHHRKSSSGGGGGGGGRGGFKSVIEVVKEIQVQFERASASGRQLDRVLEVGKLRYQRKNHTFQVSTKMLNVITPSLPSTSKDSQASVDGDGDITLRSLNLSASLQKLYLWEKKLFEEVKSEEKMRISHERKVAKLKHMNERGAEPQKIESTRSVVRGLSTKITIAIQIVDRISATINKVRDEELWPQLKELILGLSRMWKAMLECHHNQCQAIDGGRGLDAIAFPNNPTDSHLEATLKLEHDLINWTCRFTDWVGAQKGYVRALNSWLLKCLLYEPEETADGIAPFSPGRAGAPPVFVICNQWNQSMERISETSEKEVINSMRVFAMMVWHFRERDKGEMRQRATVNRDIEKRVKNFEREDAKIQKEIQALDKKMELTSGASDGLSLSGHVVYQSDTSSKTSVQAGLRHIFEALERFTSDSVKAYEELLQRTEELVGRNGMAS